MHEDKNYWREQCKNSILLDRKAITLDDKKITATAVIIRTPPWFYPWVSKVEEHAVRLAKGVWIRVSTNEEIPNFCRLYRDLEKTYNDEVYADFLMRSAEES
jgi:hypothetical protein